MDWSVTKEPLWDDAYNYRIAPAPKLRPWTTAEVPLLALIRSKNPSMKTDRGVIFGISGGVIKSGNGANTPAETLERFEHSIDGGKTWLPCGVMEGGE